MARLPGEWVARREDPDPDEPDWEPDVIEWNRIYLEGPSRVSARLEDNGPDTFSVQSGERHLDSDWCCEVGNWSDRQHNMDLIACQVLLALEANGVSVPWLTAPPRRLVTTWSYVIGIDPGLAACGMAVVMGEKCLGAATWKHGPAEGTDEERGAAYVQDLYRLGGFEEAPILACESQFTAPRGTGAEWMSQQQVTLIRGMLSGAAAAWGWRVLSVTPAEAKRALTGRGNADKGAMCRMAQSRFNLPTTPSEHIADALGVALAAQRKLLEEELHPWPPPSKHRLRR
jgi:Holliday junction resolvasome RuvABC endonuclease subunit